MLLAILIAWIVFILVLMIHCATIVRFRRRRKETLLSFGLLMTGLATLHLLEVGIYALAFQLGAWAEIGGFTGGGSMSAMDTYYFSLINFTTVGLGPSYPTGHLRFLAGFESFNGFLCISMSASIVFQQIKKLQH